MQQLPLKDGKFYDQASRGGKNPRAPTDTELAATKIQAGFRGYQVRKQYRTHDRPHQSPQQFTRSSANDKRSHIDIAPQPQYQPMSVRMRSDADIAAAKIQASFRGYMTRRELKYRQPEIHYSGKPQEPTSKWSHKSKETYQPNDSQIFKAPFKSRDQNSKAQNFVSTNQTRIHSSNMKSDHSHTSWDHNDPNDAATIIQANFRGYQTRKALHIGKDPKPSTYASAQYLSTEPADKENAEQAATRIQASYRGFRTRKQLEKLHLTPRSKHHNDAESHHITNPDEAATKIQAVFRGFTTRQRVNLPHLTGKHDQ